MAVYTNPFVGDPYSYGQSGPEWNWGFGVPGAPAVTPTQPGTTPPPGTTTPGTPGSGSGGGPGGNSGGPGSGDHTTGDVAHGGNPGDIGGGIGTHALGSSPGPLIGSPDNTGPGQINIGKWGRIALGIAGLAPGPLGAVASLANAGMRAYNMHEFNNQTNAVGVPGLGFGQELGGMLGLNPYGGGTWGAHGVIGMAGVGVDHPGTGLGVTPGEALGGYNGQGRPSAIGPISGPFGAHGSLSAGDQSGVSGHQVGDGNTGHGTPGNSSGGNASGKGGHDVGGGVGGNGPRGGQGGQGANAGFALGGIIF